MRVNEEAAVLGLQAHKQKHTSGSSLEANTTQLSLAPTAKGKSFACILKNRDDVLRLTQTK
jgi:hypothetical protein